MSNVLNLFSGFKAGGDNNEKYHDMKRCMK